VAVKGDSLNPFDVSSDRRFTHVRLTMFPDGGIARLRVHGSPVPDPRQLAAAELDLAALVNGGSIAGCSNMFYSSPNNLISPGEARTMGEGWETARRRDGGNDWVEVELAGAGALRQADIDTSYFVGNSPGWASLTGVLPDGSSIELLPRTRLQPDTVHRLRLDPHAAVSRVRIDVFPDGGLARLRLHGTLTTAARAALAVDWFNRLPAAQATSISAVARPITDVAVLPAALRAELGC
jgi:allantoicase